jgi:enamine deaminase RidA (YjgF/YER057c/UK114 family)
MAKRAIAVGDVLPSFEAYPVAVEADGLLYISGLRGGRPDATPTRFDELPASFHGQAQGFTMADAMEGAFSADAWTVHENLEKVMVAAGSDGSQVLRQHVWQKDKRFFPQYERVRIEWQKVPSPSSGLGAADIAGRFGRYYGIDALGVVPGKNERYPERATVRTFDNKDLPSASYYSQAVRCGPLIFLAGHIPIQTDQPGKPLVRSYDDVPEEGRILMTGRSHPDSRHGPIAAQTWYTYDQIRKNLAAQGLSMDDIIQVTIFLQDIRDFGAFHKVHRHFFPEGGPAMTVTGFDEVGHRGTLIEIEPTALDPQSKLEPKALAWPIPAPFAGPAAVVGGDVAFFAGMLGLNEKGHLVRDARDIADADGQRIVADLEARERVPGLAAQCWAAWALLRDTMTNAGMPLDALTKTTVYLREAEDLVIYEAIRSCFIRENLPAFDCVVVHGPGPVVDALVQIEAIASTSDV